MSNGAKRTRCALKLPAFCCALWIYTRALVPRSRTEPVIHRTRVPPLPPLAPQDTKVLRWAVGCFNTPGKAENTSLICPRRPPNSAVFRSRSFFLKRYKNAVSFGVTGRFATLVRRPSRGDEAQMAGIRAFPKAHLRYLRYLHYLRRFSCTPARKKNATSRSAGGTPPPNGAAASH